MSGSSMNPSGLFGSCALCYRTIETHTAIRTVMLGVPKTSYIVHEACAVAEQTDPEPVTVAVTEVPTEAPEPMAEWEKELLGVPNAEPEAAVEPELKEPVAPAKKAPAKKPAATP